jgi:hypothetical protein
VPSVVPSRRTAICDLSTANRGTRLPGWTRPPGGVDVAADLADGTGRLAIETKVGKPEVSIWDAIKLADIQVFEPRGRAGYWCPTPTGPPALALAAPGDIIRIVQVPFRAPPSSSTATPSDPTPDDDWRYRYISPSGEKRRLSSPGPVTVTSQRRG